MTQTASIEQAVERLRAIIATGNLPPKQQTQAKTLLDRLETPLRVVILGWRNRTQPRLVNALLGREVIPHRPDRSPQEILFGAEPCVTVTGADGNAKRFSECPDQDLISDALFVQHQCDALVLRRFSILDLALAGPPADMRKALRWAASRADIAIWCSDHFSDAEREIWRDVPERLKDHAFLALTKDTDGDASGEIGHEHSADFLDVVQVGGNLTSTNNRTAGSNHGACRLKTAILQHIDEGLQADTAGALLFLHRHETDTAGKLPERPVLPSSAAEQENSSSVVAFSRRDRIDRPAASEKDDTDAKLQSALRSASAYLRQRAIDLFNLVSENKDVEATAFVAHCGETIRQLSSIMDSVPQLMEGEAIALSNALLEAEEIVVLLEIERGGSVEMDAACVLLQLRHEFESKLAA